MNKFNKGVEESEIRYSNLINSIIDILLELSLDLTIIYINPYVYNLLGYSPEEMIRKSIIDIIHPDEKVKIIEIINRSIKTKDIISTELKLQHKKGYYLTFSAKGCMMQYNSHTTIVLLLRDITQMRDVQQKLMEFDEKYREIIENIEDGYFEVDLQGNYTYVNNYICRYLGIPREQLLGRSYKVATDKDTIKEVFKIFNNLYKNNLPKGIFESQVIRSDGEVRTFEGSFYLRYNDCGRKVGFYGFTRDITEKKEAEKKIKQSEKQFREAYDRAELYKDLFYHDINNILTNINMAFELSEKDLKEQERESEISEYYEIIKKQLARGAKLVSNVQKLSSLDISERSFKVINAIKVLNDAINFILVNKKIQDIDIAIDSFQDDISIQVDDLLIDVFENLLINALTYNDKPKVEIIINISKEIQKNIKFIKFEFMDNGIGISDEIKQTIFIERFKKEKGSKGMGIGLTLVKKILESYKGEIWVEDRVKGDYSKGSNFIFLIPEALEIIKN